MDIDRKSTVAVAVCTCNRNGPLADLLRALLVNAARVKDRASVGVVVVDDSSDGQARVVVEEIRDQFDLGVTYLRSGRRNISIARNMAIEAATRVAEWVAMTDDDCEPVPCWLEALVDMQRRTGADAVCGWYRRRAPGGAPAWLSSEPFLDIALHDWEDGAAIEVAGTNNSMISSKWWLTNPTIRFKSEFGVTGGEDMVFYRTARAAGLEIVFAKRAEVFENEPMSRATLAYQLRHFFWLGNSSYLTRLETGAATPFRMFLQGGNQIRKAVVRSIRRLWRGQTPQLRYCLALILHGAGLMLGPLGLRARHH